MKALPRFLFAGLGATALVAAALAGEPKEDLRAALAKLEAASGYSWKLVTEIEGFPFQPGPQTGKFTKDGWTLLTAEMNGETVTAVLKGTNGVVKTADGWKTGEELPQPQFGGGGPPDMTALLGRQLLGTKPPGVEAATWLEKVKEFKATGDQVVGDLTPEGAKELASMRRGRRGGGTGGPPEPKDAKGDVRYWLKEGQVQKITLHTESKMTSPFDNTERTFIRTSTVELSDIGSTKVEIPAEAKAKLESKK